MTSTILITNVQNIDFGKMIVIDNSKVFEEKYDSDIDILLLENKNNGRQRMSNLMQVSLFDDLIIKDNEKFKILRMLSR
jgi:hypothetical protein|tara:strand:+ start:323 stop:559 length:237 start_codon:yes stop_codon:yes gene_type:complete